MAEAEVGLGLEEPGRRLLAELQIVLEQQHGGQ
jgi:hypothetical protein